MESGPATQVPCDQKMAGQSKEEVAVFSDDEGASALANRFINSNECKFQTPEPETVFTRSPQSSNPASPGLHPA